MNKENIDVKIREVNESDIEFLWYLRNLPETYRYSRNSRKVAYEEHLNWIMPILMGEKENVNLYVILCDGKRAGQVRFDLLEKQVAEVSISIFSKYWGKGVALSGMKQGMEIMKNKDIRKFIAEVKKENIGSLHFFTKAGFKSFKEDKDYQYFNYLC